MSPRNKAHLVLVHPTAAGPIPDVIPKTLWQRFDRESFWQRLWRHLRRWGFAYALAALAILWFDGHFRLGLNLTQSLPQRLFLIERGAMPKRGDFVAFRWHGGGTYPKGVTFIKKIAGVPGDAVTRIDQDFFVNCVPVGKAKPTSRQGMPLEPGPAGTLPAGSFYVRTPHPDSLDSRYALTGWVTQSQFIGRAHALF